MCGFGGGGGNNAAADQQRQDEQNRQTAINNGMGQIDNAFAPFNDDYYKQFERTYSAQARPDLDKQQKDANQEALFGLARAGLTKSGAAAKVYGDIADTRARGDLQVADDARTASAEQRGQVEQQRNSLVGQLNATANANAAGQAANNQAILMSKPPTYSPITNLFSEITGHWALNEQARRNGSEGWGWGLEPVADPVRGSRGSVREMR